MSTAHADNSTWPELSPPARQLMGYLLDRGAVGPDRAVTEARVARALDTTPRIIRKLTREILDRAAANLDAVGGLIPCTRTTPPRGIFLTDDPRVIGYYYQQLTNRGLANLSRRRSVRLVRNELIERRAHHGDRHLPGGQMLLPVET